MEEILLLLKRAILLVVGGGAAFLTFYMALFTLMLSEGSLQHLPIN